MALPRLLAAGPLEALARQAREHRLLAGIGANLVSEIGRAALLPVIAVVAARYLGLDRYGIFATGQVLVAFAATFAGFGLLHAILQLGSRGQEPLSSLLPNSIAGGLVTAALAFGGLFLWVRLFDYASETRAVALIMGASLFPTAVNGQLTAALQLRGRYSLIAFSGAVATAVNLAYAVAVVAGDFGLNALAAAPLVASTALTGVLAWPLRGELKLSVHPRMIGSLFGTGFLFGVGDLLYFVYLSIDLVLLSLISGERDVGLYNVPVRVLMVAYLLPMVVFNRVLYPRYFEWSASDPERLRRTYALTTRSMLFAGLLFASVLLVAADWTVSPVFGSAFAESEGLLRILALALPLRYVSGSASAVLGSTGLIGYRVRLQAATAALNVGLCLALIPPLGATGAAIATVVTEAFLAVVQLAAVRTRVLDVDLVKEARPWLFALPGAALLAGAVGHQPEWAIALSGLVAVTGLAVIAGPMRFFGRLGLPLPARSAAERERASLA